MALGLSESRLNSTDPKCAPIRDSPKRPSAHQSGTRQDDRQYPWTGVHGRTNYAMMQNGKLQGNVANERKFHLLHHFHVDTRNQFHGRAPFWNPDPCSGFSERLYFPGAHQIIIGGRLKRVSDLVMSRNRATVSLRIGKDFSLFSLSFVFLCLL